MKKLFLALILSVCLTVAGCISGPNGGMEDVSLVDNRPAEIQYIEEISNGQMLITDYRIDAYTMWLWIDLTYVDGECDAVVVLKFLPGKDQQTGFQNIGMLARDVGPMACHDGYQAYGLYLEKRPNA